MKPGCEPDDDLYEVSLAAKVGRHIVAWCLCSLSCMWTVQLYRGGGTSGLLRDVHLALGDGATGGGLVVSLLLLFALFGRRAKIAGGLAFSGYAGLTGIIGALHGHVDVGLMFLLSMLPLGFAMALMAKAGRGS